MTYTFNAKVQQFPGQAAWFYVTVPQNIQKKISGTSLGMVPIRATIRNTTWKTSLLPTGDGTLFIALKKEVRTKENITIGNKIHITFEIDFER